MVKKSKLINNDEIVSTIIVLATAPPTHFQIHYDN